MVWDEIFGEVCKWNGSAQIFIWYRIIHSLTCFWACEDGLWCRHPESQIASFMLQNLHYQRDNGFSTMTTRAIRLNLSKYIPKNEKYAFSSKSLRIASVTKMASHRGVNFFDIHARSGHSLETNQERYLDWNTISLILPGAYTLNGWVD